MSGRSAKKRMVHGLVPFTNGVGLYDGYSVRPTETPTLTCGKGILIIRTPM